MVFPKVRLVGLGERTLDGRVVGAALLKELYGRATEKDREFFEGPTEKEIDSVIEHGISNWFVIENERGEIVGTIATSFENRPKEKIAWRIFSSGLKGWIGRTFILPQFRGKGFAGASKLEIEKMAKARGLKEFIA